MSTAPDPSEELVERYRQILAQRGQAYSGDSVFGGAKNLFEKALLERLGAERDAKKAEALVDMYAQLAFFLPEKDMELLELCRRRAGEDPDFKAIIDLVATGDHEVIQKRIEAKKAPELTRYYALHRRVLNEAHARRQQAKSVRSLAIE